MSQDTNTEWVVVSIIPEQAEKKGGIFFWSAEKQAWSLVVDFATLYDSPEKAQEVANTCSPASIVCRLKILSVKEAKCA